MRFEYTAADAAHFWSRVDRSDEDGCWPWTGSRVPNGYGTLTFRQRSYRAPRFAYVLAYGEIPDGLFVCHRCDNPPCCRPDHLDLGDQRANMRDAARKGRAGGFARNPALGHRGASHHSARLTPEIIRQVRRRAAEGEMQRRLARELGVSETAISCIVRGRSWKHVT